MQNRGVGLAVAGVAIVAAVVLFIVLSGGDDNDDADTTTSAATTQSTTGGGDTTTTTTTKPEPEIATIEIKDGQAVGGVQDLEFSEGDDVRFEVQSDEPWEIHFHGYDIAKEVEAGGSVEYDVPATIPGVFEVEIEDTATQIAEVTVD
jgi:hypothetical protein